MSSCFVLYDIPSICAKYKKDHSLMHAGILGLVP